MKENAFLQPNIQPAIWQQASIQLLEKMFTEFMYEDIIHPVLEKEEGKIGSYCLTCDNGVEYRFQAKKRLFDSFQMIKGSIERGENGQFVTAIRCNQFLIDIQSTIGMKPITAGHLMKEYQHTLLADSHILTHKQQNDIDLTSLDYAEIEGEMEGHPWITYNKGRIGFGYDDYLAFAPESRQEVKLFWIAVHQSIASFQSLDSIQYESFIQKECGETLVEQFTTMLEAQQVQADDYMFIPVHVWQWNNMIVPLFSEQVGMKHIIPLTESEDTYLPQQSIRTFVNRTNKQKHHVKLPMSILNTLVYRGLPGERTVIAPDITAYIQGIYAQDHFLKEECNMILLGEVASLHVKHDDYENMPGVPYQYLEMLGCIWRESIYSYLEEGEKAVTLASLLYSNGQDKPFISQLVEQSGLTIEEWMKKFFDVVLPPLLHYLYQYGTVFSPHGENTILVLKDGVPHRLAMKDFVDDVNISDQPLPELESLTADLKQVLRSEPPEGLCQFIFTGLFICHLRYLSNIVEDVYGYDEVSFWTALREAIEAYHTRFPELQDRFALFNLLEPEMTKLCLNRNRMLDYGYADDGERPHASEFGKVRNPLHEVKQYASV
ncbi:IucA/IucC family protein [Longirhabdus pacifica]|uniref:IucA/IucC family protein n=1 Tax=Longirhabdus pacifica TaxID=2305227 RepID=UPI0013E8CBC0|nr:IucA/IucC family siderophore biosynthesis protein [Longirhabdus pacifica]